MMFGAAVDAATLVLNLAGTATPGVPASAGTAVKAARAAQTAKHLPDRAPVCRGGLCTADRFANGSGVTIDSAGKLQGVSVNSAEGKTVEELCATFPNPKVGVTTVGAIRQAGGDVIPAPTANNPDHCTLCDITPEQAEGLFTPIIPNPNR
jgi:hypothetical protein